MAHIVSVANVCEFQAAQSAEAFLEREKVRQRLARMKAIGKRVDHRDPAVLRQAIQRPLRKYARDDSVNHALEVLCYVADGFARPKPRCRMVKKHRCAAQACDSHLERHAGAQRRLFKNHRQKLSFERATIAVRPRFDVRRQVEEFAHLRRSPFHSGQKIVCEC